MWAAFYPCVPVARKCTDPVGPQDGMFKTVLGNGWADCSRGILAYPPENASMYIGFRCARPAQ